ncbi:YcxB family protein [Xenophilus sp.]|uniref:YcxB family protein n=3 Tax=Xenophilus sp. TaxID=1873499 RepID=UPI0037DC2E46
MSHSFLITEDDYLAAMQLHARPRGWQWAFIAALALLCVLALLFMRSPWREAGLGGLIGLAAMMLLTRFVIGPLVWRRHYRRYPAIRQPMEIELLDTGLRLQSPSGESRLAWEQMVKWRENDRLVLVYVSPVLFHLLPRHALPAGFDVQALRDALAKHLGPPR